MKLAQIWFKLCSYKYVYPLEFAGRGSDTQLQVGKKKCYALAR